MGASGVVGTQPRAATQAPPHPYLVGDVRQVSQLVVHPGYVALRVKAA